MIHVRPADEPRDFDVNVRQPGLRAVAEMVGKTPASPRTAGRAFAQRQRRARDADGVAVEVPIDDEDDLPANELPPYWTRALPALMEAYDRICAYSCFRIHPVTGGRSVDHFAPKSRRWDAVYEWSNYRLACRDINARKSDFEDVLDPFEIEDGWFQLELYGFQIHPAPGLDADLHPRVQTTIDRLGLNDDLYLEARERDVELYLQGDVSLDVLREESPFVAMELRRQGRLHDADA